MIEGFWLVLLISMIPAAGNMAGALLAEFIRVSREAESLALHLAAGVVLAVVAIEIMPRSLAVDVPWIPIVAFFAGSIFFIFLDFLVGLVQARFGENEINTTPWLIYFGVSVDLLSDGLMIGAGSLISIELGLLLAIAQCFADVPEGFATIVALKRLKLSRKIRVLLGLSFLVPLFIGVTTGYWGLKGKPEIFQYSMLAFTGGILFTMTVEEMIPEAHKEKDPRLAALFLSGGFVLFALMSVYLGE